MGKVIPKFSIGDVVHSRDKAWWYKVQEVHQKSYVVSELRKPRGRSSYQIDFFQERMAVLSEESMVGKILQKYS